MLLGTVAYLSPEQVERGIADARSDVYAAGLLLFEMLTGTKAFTGDTPIHVAYQHVHGTVPAPSSRVPTVPAELDAAGRRSRPHRDPDDRPADADAFLREVRRSPGGPDPGRAGPSPRSGHRGLEHDRPPSPCRARAATPATGTDRRRAGPALPRPHQRPTGGPARRCRERRSTDRRWYRRRWLPAALAALLGVAASPAWFFLAGPGASTTVPPVVSA